MTEQVDSGQPAPDNGESLPEPVIDSAPAGDKPNSQVSPGAETAVSPDVLREIIADEVVRAVQSQKDRRFAALERQYGELSTIREAMDAYREKVAGGMSEGEAQSQLILEALERRLANEVQQQQAKASVSNQPQGSGDWRAAQARILSKAGIDESDPRIADFVRGRSWTSYDRYLEDLTAEAIGWAGQRRSAPQPSAGAVAQSSSGTARPDQVGDLMQAYQQELTRIRPGDVGSVHALKVKYRKLGYDPG